MVSNMEVASLVAGLAGLGIVLVFIVLISLILTILVLVGKWNIYKKMGVQGWEVLLPIHSEVVLFQKVGISPAWILLPLYSGIVPVLGWLTAGISALVLTILAKVRLAKAFGRSTAFAVGLILLEPIFVLILGFGESKYIANEETVEEII